MLEGRPKKISSILIYGYGNPGRMDDGLGVQFSEQMKSWVDRKHYINVDFETNYQLNIEDAHTISEYDLVIFADATVEPIDEYLLTYVEPSDAVNFSMHSVSPSYVVYLCQSIYKKLPLTYLLHIKGYEWEFEERLTQMAQSNLKKSLAFTHKLLRQLNVQRSPNLFETRVSFAKKQSQLL